MAIESIRFAQLMHELALERTPYLDKTLCPDMAFEQGELLLYRLRADDHLAAIGQSIEGEVLSEEWSYPRSELMSACEAVDQNTTWLLLILRTQSELLPVGTMSIADCVRGASETIASAQSIASRTGISLPVELRVSERDVQEGLWDIMQLSVLRPFRRSMASAWIQHGLYRWSCDPHRGAARCISNMTAREFRAVQLIGTPFKAIAGLSGTGSQLLAEKEFYFQTINVSEIRPSMGARIASLLAKTPRRSQATYLADVTSVVLDGYRTRHPESTVGPTVERQGGPEGDWNASSYFS